MQHGYVAPNYAGKGEEIFYMRDRYSLNRKLSDWQNMTIDSVENYYSNMYEFAGFKIRFDDFADPTGATSNGIVNSAVRFSSTRDKILTERIHCRNKVVKNLINKGTVFRK